MTTLRDLAQELGRPIETLHTWKRRGGFLHETGTRRPLSKELIEHIRRAHTLAGWRKPVKKGSGLRPTLTWLAPKLHRGPHLMLLWARKAGLQITMQDILTEEQVDMLTKMSQQRPRRVVKNRKSTVGHFTVAEQPVPVAPISEATTEQVKLDKRELLLELLIEDYYAQRNRKNGN